MNETTVAAYKKDLEKIFNFFNIESIEDFYEREEELAKKFPSQAENINRLIALTKK